MQPASGLSRANQSGSARGMQATQVAVPPSEVIDGRGTYTSSLGTLIALAHDPFCPPMAHPAYLDPKGLLSLPLAATR